MTASDFWTRRRAAVDAETREQQQLDEIAAAEQRDAALAEQTDEEILLELGLPDPDTLQQGDDFKVFLTQTVPARIRTRALRRLWVSDPILANVDGLVDYGEDFTDAACVIENLQTAYQVGKGMTAHVEELARQAEIAAPHEDEAIDPAQEDHTPDDVIAHSPDIDTDPGQPQEAQQPEIEIAAALHAPVDTDMDAHTDMATTPRRMRFRFETDEASL